MRRRARGIRVRWPRKLTKDIRILGLSFGGGNVEVDADGRWFLIRNYRLLSRRYLFSVNPIYVVGMVPRDYGERRGAGAGIEEFYVNRDLRYRHRGKGDSNWKNIPNTHTQIDRRSGAAVKKHHLYACVHLQDFDPRTDDVRNSLAALQMLLTDPLAFK